MLAQFRQDAVPLIQSAGTTDLLCSLQTTMLESYLYDGDDAGLIQAARNVSAQYGAAGQALGVGQIWQGIGQLGLGPQGAAAVAGLFDFGHAGGRGHWSVNDNLPTKAAFWRAAIARQQGDTATMLACQNFRPCWPGR